MMFLRQLKIIVCFSTMVLFGSANATLIDVNFIDNDGPQWQGVVDTSLDTLTITSWTDGNGGARYWTPLTDLTFQAYQTVGGGKYRFDELVAFDVSDNWDGIISQEWGFLSNLTKQDIQWQQGQFLDNDARIGWGMHAYNDGTIDTGGTERFLGYVPFGARINTISFADEVNISSVTVSEAPSIAVFTLAIVSLLSFRLRT